LNKQDAGNRRFLLVEIEPSIAKKITAERLKRIILGYGKKNGLGGGFSYCELGLPLLDLNSQIRNEVTFIDLAQYVFFLETGTPLPHNYEPSSPLFGFI